MDHAKTRPLNLDEELRAAQAIESTDGAPMLLALVDLRERPRDASDEPSDPDGSSYAELVEQYCQALVPWARDDDQGALITVIKTIGFTAFGPRSGGTA